MLAKTLTCAVVGLDGYVVEVEVDISPGLPAFHVVGLPDAAVQEARERVRAAIRNSGCEFPIRRIAASLAPADLRKAGPSYDLPIALAVLISSGQLSPHASADDVPRRVGAGRSASAHQRHPVDDRRREGGRVPAGVRPGGECTGGRARGGHGGHSRPHSGASCGASARRRADPAVVAPR